MSNAPNSNECSVYRDVDSVSGMNLLALLSCYLKERPELPDEDGASRNASFRRRRQGDAFALQNSASNVSWIVRELFARNRLANLTFNASARDFVHTFRGLNKYAQYQYFVRASSSL